jgi:hypothetical protein
MGEVHRSFRVDSELFDAATRLAESRGQSFSALVVSLLGEAVEGKRAVSALPVPDVHRLEGELSKLAETVRAERLTHSEITESLIALARLSRELEQERQRTKALATEAIEGLEKAQSQLKAMVELGGFASEKCRAVVAGMEKSLSRVESLSGTTAGKMEESLQRIGAVSERINFAGQAQVEGFERQMRQSADSFRRLVQEFQSETKAQAHEFVLQTARRWQWIVCAVVVCLLGGVGASFAWNHFSHKDEIQALKEAKTRSELEVFFFLKEACNGRRVTVDKQRYCSIPGLNERTFENPFK